MPFVRFARDKRGYEHVYLVHAEPRRGRSSDALVLYWFRTPPGVKVGREPFDAEARRALEARYPNLTFDWNTIVAARMPPPEVDWRERRRVQREAKLARAAAASGADGGEAGEAGETGETQDEDQDTEEVAGPAELEKADDAGPAGGGARVDDVTAESGPQVVTQVSAPAGDGARRRRRRRGGSHRQSGPQQPTELGASETGPLEAEPTPESGTEPPTD